MTCFCKCPERTRLPWEPCENCGAADAVTCVKVTIDGYYWPIYLQTSAGNNNLCGTAVPYRNCFTRYVYLTWKVKSDCSDIDFVIIEEITNPGDSITRVVTRTTQADDWHTTGFTIGDYTVEVCTGDPAPVHVSTIRCIYATYTMTAPPFYALANYLAPRDTSQPNDLCGIATLACPPSCGDFFGNCPYHINGVRWALSQTSAEIIITVVGSGSGVPLGTWNVSLASWQALGTFAHPTIAGLSVTTSDVECVCPSPCDSSSTDCFPDCISAMTGPDCDTPAHSTLFVELVGPPGRGCCLDNTHTLTYGGGFGAGYSLSRTLTQCNTSGGDPVWFEMQLYCSGSDIILDIEYMDVRGITSTATSTITMSCVDGNVSYSFTIGARYMCDSSVIGDVYTITIFSNN